MNPGTVKGFVSGVRLLAEGRILKALSQSTSGIDVKMVMAGKMLRTRLAGRLCAGGGSSVDRTTIQAACTATELVHTASLCHDDVVDNSLIRRSLPTLWRTVGSSGAILIGDLLLCEAMDLLMETDTGPTAPYGQAARSCDRPQGRRSGRLARGFLAKVTEVVKAEARGELLWRGKEVDVETCLHLARGKTGPLFAFVAGTCGGEDETLCGLLEEAGYRIGTAYQLTDDLVDILGAECTVGKTLGTDLIRGKFTLPQISDAGERVARESINNLCLSAVELLNDYPKARKGLTEFLRHDLGPVLEQTSGVETGIAV